MKVIQDKILTTDDIRKISGFKSGKKLSEITKKANQYLTEQGKNSYPRGYATLHSVYHVLGLSIAKEID